MFRRPCAASPCMGRPRLRALAPDAGLGSPMPLTRPSKRRSVSVDRYPMAPEWASIWPASSPLSCRPCSSVSRLPLLSPSLLARAGGSVRTERSVRPHGRRKAFSSLRREPPSSLPRALGESGSFRGSHPPNRRWVPSAHPGAPTSLACLTRSLESSRAQRTRTASRCAQPTCAVRQPRACRRLSGLLCAACLPHCFRCFSHPEASRSPARRCPLPETSGPLLRRSADRASLAARGAVRRHGVSTSPMGLAPVEPDEGRRAADRKRRTAWDF